MPGQRHDKPSSQLPAPTQLSSPGDLAVDKAELLKALCPSHRTTHRTPHHPITPANTHR